MVLGEAESDGFNRLVIGAGLAWRDVTILRAVAKFLRQAAIPFSQDYMEQALARNPDIARLLVELFHALQRSGATRTARRAREPDSDAHRRRRSTTCRAWTTTASSAACAMSSPMCCAPISISRTRTARPKPVFAIKLDSPEARRTARAAALVEIFVYSPDVEGVHLRFGKVARGGIRWSDRREDFRTEMLGLVKAQQVKNAVIVPVGAKGGFYPKQHAGQSDARRSAGRGRRRLQDASSTRCSTSPTI